MEKKLNVDIAPALELYISTIPNANIGMDMAVIVDGTPYTGSTNVIPTTETQVLPTAGTLVQEDIIVEPIPSNYGLITWNGTVLTVS